MRITTMVFLSLRRTPQISSNSENYWLLVKCKIFFLIPQCCIFSSLIHSVLNSKIKLIGPIWELQGNPQIQLDPWQKSGSSQQILKISIVNLIIAFSFFPKISTIKSEDDMKNSSFRFQVTLKDAHFFTWNTFHCLPKLLSSCISNFEVIWVW